MESKFNILIVDDNAELASSLQDVLEAEGYTAAVALDGQTALTKLGENSFNMGIIDIKLPDISGMDLTEAMIELVPEVEYIIITGYASLNTAVEAAGRRPVVAYMTKPLNMEQLLALIRQVVERRKVEEELRKSEDRHQLLMDNSVDGIWFSILEEPIDITLPEAEIARLLSEREIIVEANDVLAKMYGFDEKSQLVGKRWLELISAEDNPRESLELVRSHYKIDRRVRTEKDSRGNITYYEESEVGNIVNNKLVSLFGFIRDISERKRVEEKRKELERKAYVSSRLTSIGEMASGIAHEINNPLAAVIGFAHLLMERKDVPDDIRKALETVHDGSVRVADIVRRLLTFARQDRAVREYVKISDIIENTLALRAYAMKAGNIEIRTYLDPDLPRTMAAGGQLQQVFLNIIINAETEMTRAHGKGSLLIKTEVAGETIRVSFEDDGPGITPENMDRLFEPFFTTKEPGEGTGLGLSICHGIITEHGGRLYARSELGQGATFIVELPVVAVERQVELAEVAVEEGEKVTGAKILVVDDELGIRNLLSQVLTDEGHSVETLDNATEALERIKGERYNLILVDIKMPGMSGIELYKNIKGIAGTLGRRMVFITGDVIAPGTRDFLTRTGVPYITKPFDIEQLKEDINRLVER